MKYKFEDIIFNITQKKKPVEEDKYNYIGLEHLESGNLFISKWGSDTAPEGEKIVMKKGDVLFGKRRAYQKKVAISPIDGIFSAHGMVLRPKEDVICKEFLPFFISSETFLNEAIRISVGGLSPTVNWKDIKELEFDLPSLAEQKVLAEKLWAAYEVKQSYLKMIEATEQMVKSQFIKMFGDTQTLYKIGDLFQTCSGGTPNRKKSEYFMNGKIPWVTSGEINKVYIESTDSFITELGLENSSAKWVPENSVLIAMYGGGTVGKVGLLKIPATTNQAICALLPNEEYNSLFAFYMMKMKEEWMASQARGAAQENISQNFIKSIMVPKPSMMLQDKFVEFAKQADKSISELRKSIDAIDKVIKSLINENL